MLCLCNAQAGVSWETVFVRNAILRSAAKTDATLNVIENKINFLLLKIDKLAEKLEQCVTQ
jgi:hypothetical protein